MNIILSGYGKMGKIIEKVAISRGHTVTHIIDREEDWKELESMNPGNTVVIDFSQPEVVVNNIRNCFKLNLPVVVGTTGWNEQMPAMADQCITEKQSLFVASNFSIGVNILFAVNQYLASLMNNYPEYNISLQESHHIHKLDKPSGTAITLLDQLINTLDSRNSWSMDDGINTHQIKVEAHREGEVFGDHSVLYDSPVDRLEIRHSAKSREGFALGAVMAAEWLPGKTGNFTMKDMLGI